MENQELEKQIKDQMHHNARLVALEYAFKINNRHQSAYAVTGLQPNKPVEITDTAVLTSAERLYQWLTKE